MQMQIEFSEVHGAIGDGVAFSAMAGGKRIVCIATGAALRTVAGYSAATVEPLDQYARHAPLLHDIAEILILAGRVKDGIVFICAEDVSRTPNDSFNRNGRGARL